MMPAAAGGLIVLQATLGSLTERAHLWHQGRSHIGPEQRFPSSSGNSYKQEQLPDQCHTCGPAGSPQR